MAVAHLGGRAFGPPLCGGIPPQRPLENPLKTRPAANIPSSPQGDCCQPQKVFFVLRGPSWIKKGVLRPSWPFVDQKKVFSVVLRGPSQKRCSPPPFVALRGSKEGVLRVAKGFLRGPSWPFVDQKKVFSAALRGPSWIKRRCSSCPFVALRGSKEGVLRGPSWTDRILPCKGVLRGPSWIDQIMNRFYPSLDRVRSSRPFRVILPEKLLRGSVFCAATTPAATIGGHLCRRSSLSAPGSAV